MKICTRCGDTAWPIFLVNDLCRMCQARRRDELRYIPIHNIPIRSDLGRQIRQGFFAAPGTNKKEP